MMNQARVSPSRRLRVAVLHRIFSPAGGGAERYAVALVEELAARYEFHVFSQVIAHQWPGVHYHQVPLLLRRPRWLNQLWYAITTWLATRRGFDLVHSHENTWCGQVQTFHVKTVQGSLLGEATGFRRAWRRLKTVLSPRKLTYLALERARVGGHTPRVLVAVSQTLADELVREYPRARARLSVIAPGVKMPLQPISKDQARRSLDIWPDAQVALFVANDYARKGLDALLQALACLPESLCLLVVGSASQASTYQLKAQSLGLGGRVRFAGPLHDMHLAYWAADLLVHPTLEDTFGMVVLEAMAHGLPVVVSGPAFCGAAALLHDGQDALLLKDPRDVMALREAIIRLLCDGSLRQRIAERGQSFAVGQSWQHAAAAYDDLYQRLVAENTFNLKR